MTSSDREFEYLTNCTQSRGADIREMVDRARDITFETFFRHVSLREVQEMFGYGQGRGDLYLRNDWHVSFHKSWFRGKPCYYLRHSAIEYIFVRSSR